MKFFDYIGAVFLFRWLLDRARKNGRQEMSKIGVSYRDKNGLDFERYCDMDESNCFGHEDYYCRDDFLYEQEDYDMMDYDF